MKRKVKLISIYLLFITIFGFAFFVNKTNSVIHAAPAGDCTNLEGTNEGRCETVNAHGYGKVKIEKSGDITVEYTYGISEILIRAREYLGRNPQTGELMTGKEVYVFSSGEKKQNTKKIFLSNYFEKGKEVLVEMYYTFGVNSNSNFGSPLYCNMSEGNALISEGRECYGFYQSIKTKPTYKANNYSAYARIKEFYGDFQSGDVWSWDPTGEAAYDSIYKIALLDSNHLVYSVNNGMVVDDFAQRNVHTLVTIDNAAAQKDATDDVNNIIYDTIIPVLLTVLGIAATVTVVVIGYQIIKSSDEAQERNEKIRHLRGILIGLAIAMSMLAVLEPVIEFVKRWME